MTEENAPIESNDDQVLRDRIQGLLGSGLETEWQDRADDHDETQRIIKALRLSDQSLRSKLVIAGFTLDPVEHGGIEQACETCMYYLVRRRYCDLPELELPVEAEWSCNLFRI